MVDDKLTATNTATPSCAPQTEEEYTMRGGSAMHVGSHALERTQVQETFIVSGGHDTERKITMWKDALCDTLETTGMQYSYRPWIGMLSSIGVVPARHSSPDAPYFESDALERNRLAFPRASGAQRFIVERRAPRGGAVRQRIIEP